MNKMYYNALIKDTIYSLGYLKFKYITHNDNVNEYETIDNRIKIILVDDKDYTNISVLCYNYYNDNKCQYIIESIFINLLCEIVKYSYLLRSDLYNYMMSGFRECFNKNIYESFIDDDTFTHISCIQDPYHETYELIEINIFITNSLELYIPEKYINKPNKYIDRVKKGKIEGVRYISDSTSHFKIVNM